MKSQIKIPALGILMLQNKRKDGIGMIPFMIVAVFMVINLRKVRQ